MTGLREQVAAIKPGDTVTARYRTDVGEECTVSGTVGNDSSGDQWLSLGIVGLRTGHGEPYVNLVAIESHEPAKPPVPPEPTGDVVVNAGGQWWMRFAEDRWLDVADKTEYTWREVVEAEQFNFGTLPQVYRPEPSPERIEELVRWLDAVVRECIDDVLADPARSSQHATAAHNIIKDGITDLLRGAS